MALTKVLTGGITDSAVTNAKISELAVGKLSGLHSSWVLDPQISSPSDVYQVLTWSKDPQSVTDNLELGTDVTISSGIISFPSTGIYKLTIDMQGRHGSSNVTYVGFTWQHSSDSGSNFSIVYRRLNNVFAGAYFYTTADFYYNVTNTTTQRLRGNLYATAASGLVIDGGDSYTSTRLYITRVT